MGRNGWQGYRHLQSQQWTEPESPRVSPVATNATTATVESGGFTVRRAPYTLAGCCFMGNESSALVILFVLLASSFVSIVASISMLTIGLANGFTRELELGLAFVVHIAILFPGSLAALIGVFNGHKTGGLSLLLCILVFYMFVVLISLPYFYFRVIVTCLIAVVMKVAARASHSSFDDADLMVSTSDDLIFLGLGLVYFSVVAKITMVLCDYLYTIRRRGMSIPL